MRYGRVEVADIREVSKRYYKRRAAKICRQVFNRMANMMLVGNLDVEDLALAPSARRHVTRGWAS